MQKIRLHLMNWQRKRLYSLWQVNTPKIVREKVLILYFDSVLLLLAGFETSSSALTFCLYELAIQPEIQAKARHAIKMACQKYGGGSDDGQLTYEMMLDMPYIDQILEGECSTFSWSC